jgi:hypothetical protein
MRICRQELGFKCSRYTKAPRVEPPGIEPGPFCLKEITNSNSTRKWIQRVLNPHLRLYKPGAFHILSYEPIRSGYIDGIGVRFLAAFLIFDRKITDDLSTLIKK